MIKTFAIAGIAALAICAGGQASAATAPAPTIAAGQYAGVLQFTAVNDPNGFCNGIVATGEIQPSVASFALGTSSRVITPVTGTGTSASPYGVVPQICNYAASPTTLSSSGTTPADGTTTCTGPQGTFQIVTGQSVDGVTGSSTINTVNKPAQSFKITTTNAALEAPVGPGGAYVAICFISTDSLFVRSGK